MADKLTFKKPVEFEAGSTVDFGNNSITNLILPITTTISSDRVTGLADELAKKVDTIEGKQLSTNDYDATAKTKVDSIPEDPKYTDTITTVTITQEQMTGTKIATVAVNDTLTDLYAPESGSTVEKSNTNGNIKVDDEELTVYDETNIAKRVSDLESVGATKVEKSTTNGNILIDGSETTVYTHKKSVACHTEFLPAYCLQTPLSSHRVKVIGGAGGGIFEAYLANKKSDITVNDFLSEGLFSNSFNFDLHNYWWAVNSGKYGFKNNYLGRQTKAAGYIALENRKYTGKELIHLRKHYVSEITSQPKWRDLLVFLLGEFFVNTMIDVSSSDLVKVRVMRGYSDITSTSELNSLTKATVTHTHTPRRLAEKVMIAIPTIPDAYTDDIRTELKNVLLDGTAEKERTAHSHSRRKGEASTILGTSTKHLNLDCKVMIVRDVTTNSADQYIPTDIVAYYNITHIYYNANLNLLCLTFSSDLTENSINDNNPKNNNKNY